MRTLWGHEGSVIFCSLSYDDVWIVSASVDMTLKVWRIDTGELRLTLRGHTAPLTNGLVTPDGSRIISTSEDGTIRVWNAYSGSELLVLTEHDGTVTGCAISRDGLRLATTSADMTIKIWDISSIYGSPEPATPRSLSTHFKDTKRSSLVVPSAQKVLCWFLPPKIRHYVSGISKPDNSYSLQCGPKWKKQILFMLAL